MKKAVIYTRVSSEECWANGKSNCRHSGVERLNYY